MDRYGSIYLITNTVTKEQYVGQTRQKKAIKRKGMVANMYTMESVV